MSDDRPTRRRRERRSGQSGAGGATPGSDAAADADADAATDFDAGPPSARRKRGPKRTTSERGVRDLVGNEPSQVGVAGAMRARDVNRPTEDDLAAAERDVVIVRRHWQPPPS